MAWAGPERHVSAVVKPGHVGSDPEVANAAQRLARHRRSVHVDTPIDHDEWTWGRASGERGPEIATLQRIRSYAKERSDNDPGGIFSISVTNACRLRSEIDAVDRPSNSVTGFLDRKTHGTVIPSGRRPPANFHLSLIFDEVTLTVSIRDCSLM